MLTTCQYCYFLQNPDNNAITNVNLVVKLNNVEEASRMMPQPAAAARYVDVDLLQKQDNNKLDYEAKKPLNVVEYHDNEETQGACAFPEKNYDYDESKLDNDDDFR